VHVPVLLDSPINTTFTAFLSHGERFPQGWNLPKIKATLGSQHTHITAHEDVLMDGIERLLGGFVRLLCLSKSEDEDAGDEMRVQCSQVCEWCAMKIASRR
jgi:hypothetical protein